MLNFTHRGKLGDLIYSLFVIYKLGGGNLYATKICGQLYRILEPLLEIQPYIYNTKCTINLDNEIEYVDLNKWRDCSNKDLFHTHIVKLHVDAINKYYNLKVEYDLEKWLFVEPKK